MDGVGTPIIERPRPLRNQDTPNAAHNTYTLKCEEPVITDRIFTKNANRPRICSAQAHSYLNRRRFAGPVRAKQPKNLSLRNAQSQLIQRLHWPGRSVVPF